MIILKPRGPGKFWQHDPSPDSNVSKEANEAGSQGGPAPTTEPISDTFTDSIRETAVFGNIRKAVIAKNFVGGEVSSVFGSAEINLMQADIQNQASLELNAVFGSIRLIVPAHWQVKMETSAVLGGIEDKRAKHAIYSDKVLLLEGNAVFGGIQIESY
jgi:predicted membrane protein